MGKNELFAIPGRLWSGVKSAFKRFRVWYKSLYRGKPWYIKTVVGIATFFVCFFIYLIAVDINFLWLFGKSPSMHDIMNPKTANASYIYSADGKMIGKFYNENRTPVKFDEVNPTFFKVLIDTEDERFYDHWGIDVQGLFAAAKDMLVHGRSRGASTITQQLVKNMFRVRTQYSTGLLGYIPGVRMLIMKTKEWILATEIEIFYHDKQRILEMYANTVDFGNNAYGIKTAARTYFNTTPAQLTIEESAVLVGLLKATSSYNPRRNYDRSLKRRNVVLRNMLEHGDLTKAECDSLCSLPILLQYHPEDEFTGVGPYFRRAVLEDLKDWCTDNGVDLYTDGLEIHTTLDTRMQKYAEEAVREQMKVVQRNFRAHWGDGDCWVDENQQVIPNFVADKARQCDYYKTLQARYGGNTDSIDYYMNKPRMMHIFDYDGGKDMEISAMDSVRRMLHYMHCGLVAMEPETGYVRAWVGDVDYKTWKYDKVSAMHQPGSTFKLFVYAAAMERGLTPCDRRLDAYIDTMVLNRHTHQLERWAPHNANGRFSGANMTLRSAFAQSINSVAVRVGNEMGLSNVAQTARDMGIKSPLDETPALSLGSSDVNLEELVSAYCTVAADGMAHEPVLVTQIMSVGTDGVKKVIYTSEKEKGAARRAISHRAAYLMQKMLEASRTDGGGTSMPINAYVPYGDCDWGGKTGTSNSHADAWFVAVSPKLVCGAWVGGEYRQIHFRTGALGQGSRTALPVVGLFLRKLFADAAFSKYRARYTNDPELNNLAVGCANEYQRVSNDSVDYAAGDSIDIVQAAEEDINGTPEGGATVADPVITEPQGGGTPDENVKKAFGNKEKDKEKKQKKTAEPEV